MADPKDVVKVCLDIVNSSRDYSKAGGEVDSTIKYTRGKLGIELLLWCDGPYSIIVFYDKKVVLNYDDARIYPQGKERILLYDPGNWENEVRTLEEQIKSRT